VAAAWTATAFAPFLIENRIILMPNQNIWHYK
jgi:hypothetical protein